MLTSLLPFAVSACAYFYFLSGLTPSVQALLLKCIPIYCLAGSVYFYGKSRGLKSEYKTSIFYGLLWSSIGDACLVWKTLFPPGMLAFAIAHCFYIKAFGFKQLRPAIALVLYSLMALMLMIVMPHIKDSIVLFGMPIYGSLLVTMSWRAIARVTDGEDAWSKPRLACAVGSVLFVISDTIICFHDLQEPIPYGKVLIMTTYYTAQLGISLSIISIQGKSQSERK